MANAPTLLNFFPQIFVPSAKGYALKLISVEKATVRSFLLPEKI